MSNREKLQKIIAAYTPFTFRDIIMNISIEDRYIATEFKDDFADNICRAWPYLNCTNIHNDLFDSLKTGDDILEIL